MGQGGKGTGEQGWPARERNGMRARWESTKFGREKRRQAGEERVESSRRRTGSGEVSVGEEWVR